MARPQRRCDAGPLHARQRAQGRRPRAIYIIGRGSSSSGRGSALYALVMAAAVVAAAAMAYYYYYYYYY